MIDYSYQHSHGHRGSYFSGHCPGNFFFVLLCYYHHHYFFFNLFTPELSNFYKFCVGSL